MHSNTVRSGEQFADTMAAFTQAGNNLKKYHSWAVCVNTAIDSNLGMPMEPI